MTRHRSPRSGRAFRELGVPGPATPASTMRWFATAPSFAWRRNAAGEWAAFPTSTVHAKQMGTGSTACGLSTHAWRKFWDLAFPAERAAEACPSCREIVRRPFG